MKPLMPPDSNHLGQQVVWLVVLAIPISSIAWTITHEEVFREPREYCERKSKLCASFFQRKFFYLFTCEYCFSHYVTIFFLILTRFKLLIDDWRGYVIAFFALVSVANAYMNLYARLRVDITSEKKTIEHKEKAIEAVEQEIEQKETRPRRRAS